MSFKIYKGNTVVDEGDSPLKITGVDPGTEVEKGEYQAVRVEDDEESDRVDIPAFTTLSVVNSRETLIQAIDEASEGDTITIDGGFTLEKDVAINKDIIIDGNNHTIIVDIPESEVQDSGFRVTEGDLSVKNISIELSEGENRSFLLHSTAGSFSLKDSNIVGGDTSVDGNKGISSSTDEGVITIDNVVFSGLRTGVYRHGDNELSVNGSTFDSNYRGMTIEGSSVPTLTNNVFTNNDGDISASYDSEIREDIAEEAEKPDNNNAFDDDEPKYNWSVTGVELSPKTSSADAGEADDRQLDATIEPDHALDKGVTYQTEDAEGLSVSSSGLLEWTADTPAGTYETTVTTDDGGYTDTHVLTLEEPEAPTTTTTTTEPTTTTTTTEEPTTTTTTTEEPTTTTTTTEEPTTTTTTTESDDDGGDD